MIEVAARQIWRLATLNRWALRNRQRSVLSGLTNARVLEVGSGPMRRGRWFQSTVDLASPDTHFLMTDLDASLGHLELDVTDVPKDFDKFDLVLCCNVLEHIYELDKAVRGLAALCGPGGVAFASVPFVYPYHDEPDDYWRPTMHATRKIFGTHFQNVDVAWHGLRRFPFQLFITAQTPRHDTVTQRHD